MISVPLVLIAGLASVCVLLVMIWLASKE